MKAITLRDFGGPEMMQYSDIDTPTAGAGQLLIRVHATSVNRPDVIQRQGNYPPPPGDSEVLGLEVAGIVDAIGEGIIRFSPGDRVVALVGGGGYAEYAVALEGHTMTLPESISFEQAACICETYITAYLNLFLLGELQGKKSVLIHGGGGGVATSAIQLCGALTPDTEILVTASTGKLERVLKQGADHVIDYREQVFAEEVRHLTDKRGVDVILDHIGAKYLQDNMKSLALAGTMMLIGVMGGIKAELNLAAMMVKRQRIIGSVLRSRPVAEKADIIAKFEAVVMPLIASGEIRCDFPARGSRCSSHDDGTRWPLRQDRADHAWCLTQDLTTPNSQPSRRHPAAFYLSSPHPFSCHPRESGDLRSDDKKPAVKTPLS